MANDFGISLDDAVNELAASVEDAHNFMTTEFSQDWEIGEAYYAGKCDLPTEEGRSTVVKTETRDVIRAIMPNVMRVLLHSQKPVEYMPTNIKSAAYADQQGRWINHLFMQQGGYTELFSACMESMKLKSGPIKVFWEENPSPEHIFATGLTKEQVTRYQDDPDIVVDEVIDHETESPGGGELFDIRATRYYVNGRIRFEAFPIYEFFVRRDSNDLTALHGHRRTVTVAEAIEMGLEYDNWRELDNDNPEDNDASSAATHRRGYSPNQDNSPDDDVLNYEFLLTEAYCRYDLDGDGVPEKYVFYLGGSTYEYLHHEEIEDFCIAVVNVDPQPFTVIGRSIVDITKQSTDNETSVLRAIVDNAHQANNPRPAADPNRTNFHDLMNNSIGAPIRTKGRPDIQYVDIPFTGAGLLPFLQWLEQDAEHRVGVTKAAQGLDPDALQSTDKDAVLNTIQLSQGQVELMVRNIVNTGLIPLFRMALRLATRHMDKRQVMRFKGEVVPVDIANFSADLAAIPNVGIGTASIEQKAMTLNFIYGQQKEYMMQFGLDNPFTSLSQMYNTLEDICELGGITNMGRYFTYIDRTMEQLIGQEMKAEEQMRAEQAEKNQPLDPGRAVVMAEHTKARIKNIELIHERAMKNLELQQKAIAQAEEMDFKRDDLAQERVIELAKIEQERLNVKIKQEQEATSPNTPRREGGSGGSAAG